MKTARIANTLTVLLLLTAGESFAQKPGGWSARRLIYRQEIGSEYRVTQTRDGRALRIRYQYDDKGNQGLPEVSCLRSLETGRLESCEALHRGGLRRYQFTDEEVKVTLSGGRVSTHRLTATAHPQLLDAICAFVASGSESQKVLYIAQGSESFSTQGFVMSREGRQTSTTPAGKLECVKVKLALDFPMGLFFRLDFLVAPDRDYPYIVQGRTTTGGNFQLIRIE